MEKNFFNRYVLLTVLSVFLLSFSSKAQIESIQVGSTPRNMLVYAPSDIEKNRPLLLSLHGMNQDIVYQQNQTKWETIAKANNFVVVYPAGINNSWSLNGTSDTDFILAIIDEMYSRYEIDRKRVYLSGFSMGGMMTYYAANVIADKIAAFAPVSGYLMGGPNTNSSRPIPIIHTHGTSDDVVTYSRVQTCLDAWIKRNNCPTTAEVTKPYPADKKSSNGTKYYWGKGTDNVEVVLLSLNGVGHWHSISPNGVNTSQEIWDFCKNYSLGFGIPQFEFAAVNDNNPMQIQLTLSENIKEEDNFDGFTVSVDSQIVTINSVVLADSNQLVINLNSSILKENGIALSYSNGNVVSVYEKELPVLTDVLVENFLLGATPRLIDFSTSENGDILFAKFNMKMQIPSDVASLSIKAEYNGAFDVPVSQVSFFNNDSTILSFPLDEKVYADYQLLLTYSGNNIVSAYGGLVNVLADYPVTNNSKGLPVQIVSANINADGFTILLEFSKLMAFDDEQLKSINCEVNGKSVTIKSYAVSNRIVKFILPSSVHYADSIKISYTPGNVTAADKGALESFSEYPINNILEEPLWSKIPAKIEAENYLFQSGVETEQVSDIGGGLNVGWIDSGDWLEYAIENNTAETAYQITFRVASESGGGQIKYYIDNEEAGKITVPSTGGWQKWKSVDVKLTIGQGKHYFKIVASTGGFNINFFEIHEIETGVSKVSDGDIIIYPNPVSNEIIINSANFKHSQIDICDTAGNQLMSSKTNGEAVFYLPVQLSNGMYIVKISNEDHYFFQKIIVKNN